MQLERAAHPVPLVLRGDTRDMGVQVTIGGKEAGRRADDGLAVVGTRDVVARVS
jgi:hypothetical protein